MKYKGTPISVFSKTVYYYFWENNQVKTAFINISTRNYSTIKFFSKFFGFIQYTFFHVQCTTYAVYELGICCFYEIIFIFSDLNSLEDNIENMEESFKSNKICLISWN